MVNRRRKFQVDQRGGLLFSIPMLLFLIGLISWHAPHVTLGVLADFLISDEEPGQADAIVCLLGEVTPERVLKAAELLRAGHAPRIIFASGLRGERLVQNAPSGFRWPTSGENYLRAFQSLGIARNQLVLVDAPNAYDTNEELKAISRFVRKRGWGSVILVTSASHSGRVSMVWGRVADDIDRYVVAAGKEQFRRWWEYGPSRRAFIYEYAALGKEITHQIAHFISETSKTVDELQEEPRGEETYE